MAVPGAKPDDINISISGDTVTVSGHIERERRENKGQTYVEEIMEGTFQRSFVLPFPVDPDKANASFENGILRLTLPKSETARPRRVHVKHSRSDGKAQTGGKSQTGGSSQTEGGSQTGASSKTGGSSQAQGNVEKETVSTSKGQSS